MKRITHTIEVDALERVIHVEDTIATPLDELNLIFQAFHEATVKPSFEIFDNLVHVIVERG